MKRNQLYIWQHDIYSLEILLLCILNDIEVDGFCSSQKQYDDICGVKVFDAAELIGKSEEITVLILSGEEKKRRNFYFIDAYLYIEKFKKTGTIISLKEKPLCNVFSAGFFLLSLEEWVKSKRKRITILGEEKGGILLLVVKILEWFELSYLRKSFFEIASTSVDCEGMYIIANSLDTLKEDYHLLCERGLVPYEDFIATRPFNYLGLDHDSIFRVMPVLGYRYQFSNSNESGFVQHGNREDDSYVVVTIGDSTTDEEYSYHDSWARILYENMNQTFAQNTVVYNFGMRMYSVQQSLLLLVTQIPVLKPDLVILVSGDINMTYRFAEGNPFVSKVEKDLVDEYVSLYNDEKQRGRLQEIQNHVEDTNQYEMYIRCVKMMKAICESMKSEFISFLMPNVTRKKRLSKYEQICCYDVFVSRDKDNIYKEFNKRYPTDSSECEYMEDISDIFLETKEPIYADRCHLLPKGEKVLAEAIWHHVQQKFDNRI